MKFSKILSIILTAIILLSAFIMPISAENGSQSYIAQQNMGELSIIENNLLKLTVANDGAITLTNKNSGITVSGRNEYTESDIYSLNSYKQLMNSEIMIEYYNVSDAAVSNQSNTAYSGEADVSVEKEENRITVSYDFTAYEIGFKVGYSVSDNYMTADIDIKSISEGKTYKLNKISLLPGFFSGTGNDEGYMFVPDGCGALINYNNGSAAVYSAPVYGNDISMDERLEKSKTESIRMPVFGAVKNNSAMLAVIDEGDTAAEISAAVKNSDNYYNYVYSSLTVRNTYEKMMFSADKTDRSRSTAYYKNSLVKDIDSYRVRYYLLEENAGYSEMAAVYREYLVKEKNLKKQVGDPTLNIDLIGAIDVKANFLGFTYYKTKPLTTYEEALDILKKIKESGVDGIQLRYMGWNNNGLTNNKTLKSVSAIGKLGGRKNLSALNDWCAENSVKVDYDIELLKFYSGSKKYKVSNPFNETISFSRYLRSVYAKDISKRSWYMLSSKYLDDNFKKISSDLNKLDISNISLSTLTNLLYSDYNRKSQVTREEMKNRIVSVLSSNGNNLKISGEKANAYTLPYMSKIYSSPFYSSGYSIFDEEIPFYQIVLHGMIDLTGESQFTSEDRNINYLKAVETGTQLLYEGMAASSSNIVDTDYDYLYGTDFNLWCDDAVNKYNEYQPLLKKVYDSKIKNHSKLGDGIYRTVFENGVEVTVNYNSDEITVEGITVKGYGFYVRELQ